MSVKTTETQTDRNRTEWYLLLGNSHVIFDPRENSGLDEEAPVADSPPSELQRGPFLCGALDQIHDFIKLSSVNLLRTSRSRNERRAHGRQQSDDCLCDPPTNPKNQTSKEMERIEPETLRTPGSRGLQLKYELLWLSSYLRPMGRPWVQRVSDDDRLRLFHAATHKLLIDGVLHKDPRRGRAALTLVIKCSVLSVLHSQLHCRHRGCSSMAD